MELTKDASSRACRTQPKSLPIRVNAATRGANREVPGRGAAARGQVSGRRQERYEANLERLVERLKQTGAVLVWASTTVVPEGEAGRVVGDELKYNDAAERVMKKHGVQINDLHSLTKTFEPELFTKPGDVHYMPGGYGKIGAQAAAAIEAALKK